MSSYQKEELRFGDLMLLLEKHTTLVIFIGISDQLSLKARDLVFNFFRNKEEKVLYLHYDKNKSLMLDLNIRKIPVILIFRNMELEKSFYMPNLLEELKNYYENPNFRQST